MVGTVRCAVPVEQRVKGERYQRLDLPDSETRKWDGRPFMCPHDLQASKCKKCSSDNLCEHGLLFCTACGTNEPRSEPVCANESCTRLVRTSPYFPLCAHCFHDAQPDVARFGWKEKLLCDATKAVFPAEPFRWDRRIPGGASLYRPDFACTAVPSSSYIFIHFNPDDYTHNGTRMVGCFPRPGEVDETEWQRRVAVRFDLLRGALDHVPPQPLTVFKLFFDDAGIIVGKWDGQWPVQYNAIA